MCRSPLVRGDNETRFGTGRLFLRPVYGEKVAEGRMRGYSKTELSPMSTLTLENTERRKAWGFVAPALLWTIAFFVVPFLFMVAMSLWSRQSGQIVRAWNLDN
jgi:hypothetical protein